MRSASFYVPTEPFALALRADLIVDGVIVRFEETRATDYGNDSANPTFAIRVVEVLAGQGGAPGLTINEFRDWDCAQRYAPYEVGQRAIFFLRHERNEDGSIVPGKPFDCMGAGNDGECPVVGENVLYKGFGLQIKGRDEMDAFGHPFVGLASPRNEFVAAVTGLRGCFEWKDGPRTKHVNHSTLEDRALIRQTCTDAELEALMSSSELARAMVRDSTDHEYVRKFLKQ